MRIGGSQLQVIPEEFHRAYHRQPEMGRDQVVSPTFIHIELIGLATLLQDGCQTIGIIDTYYRVIYCMMDLYRAF